MSAIITAATVTVANSATESLGGVTSWAGLPPVRMLVRASAPVYFGGDDVSSSSGYLLNASQEYVFDFYPQSATSLGSSDLSPYIYNNSGNSVTVSYVLTRLH